MAGLWSAVRGSVAMHWLCLTVMAALTMACWWMRRYGRLMAAERWRERRMREELEAYAALEASTVPELKAGMETREAQKSLARRVCRVVSEHSVFSRVTLMLRDAEGRFVCMGSAGVDDLTVSALQAWGEQAVAEERGVAGAPKVVQPGRKSFAIPLGEWKKFDREVGSWAMSGKKERRRWRRGIVVPIRSGNSGRMAGALVVCADGGGIDGWLAGIDRAITPVEALAAKLARTIENEVLAERLLRAEKLAGLGQLAGGVAHALNNPLTAVLGFAELIAETSGELRVRKDAATIATEALKMRDTVQRLVEFWRPVTAADEPVEMLPLLREMAGACEGKLRERGVSIEVIAEEVTVPVRGSKDRLRQVMEHLLNNSAQAIAAVGARGEEEPHGIRITVTSDSRAVHVIVSDTGPGFREPGRVFDPFYTTKGPGEQGAGLGLSICYGIVREHGGEISAFNLHPFGAAVVVELPVRKALVREPVVVLEPAIEVAPLDEPGVTPIDRIDRRKAS